MENDRLTILQKKRIELEKEIEEELLKRNGNDVKVLNGIIKAREHQEEYRKLLKKQEENIKEENEDVVKIEQKEKKVCENYEIKQMSDLIKKYIKIRKKMISEVAEYLGISYNTVLRNNRMNYWYFWQVAQLKTYLEIPEDEFLEVLVKEGE